MVELLSFEQSGSRQRGGRLSGSRGCWKGGIGQLILVIIILVAELAV
jgi:hypothetical protein